MKKPSSKLRTLIQALCNDLNEYFDKDNEVIPEPPPFEMDEKTSLKVKAMEEALQGKSDTQGMDGSIFVLKNGKIDTIKVSTVNQARAVIDRVKSGELELA